jgi:hypothetical protein
MAVVADRKAVSFIAKHGGRLYVFADKAEMKHVRTHPPHDPSIRFAEIEADGFVMYVEDDIVGPGSWNVKFHHLPYHHVDVLWDGQQPGRYVWTPAVGA